MLKKLIFFVLTISFLAISPAYAYAATLSISPASGQLNKGCDVTVTIELNTAGAQTDGTDAVLNYDPTVLSITQAGITNGKIYSDYPGNSVDTATGKISVSGIASVTEAYSGKGNFASLKFKVASNPTVSQTAIKFDFDPAAKNKTTDSNVVERGKIADVLSSVTDGNYTIGTGSCAQGVGAPVASTLPITNPVASTTTLPTELPKSGLLDSTIVVTSVGMLLVILGIIGISFL